MQISTPPSVAKNKDIHAEHSSSIMLLVAVSATTASTLPTPLQLLLVNIISNPSQWKTISGSITTTPIMALLPPTRCSHHCARHSRLGTHILTQHHNWCSGQFDGMWRHPWGSHKDFTHRSPYRDLKAGGKWIGASSEGSRVVVALGPPNSSTAGDRSVPRLLIPTRVVVLTASPPSGRRSNPQLFGLRVGCTG